jgi:hypothetical protein
MEGTTILPETTSATGWWLEAGTSLGWDQPLSSAALPLLTLVHRTS